MSKFKIIYWSDLWKTYVTGTTDEWVDFAEVAYKGTVRIKIDDQYGMVNFSTHRGEWYVKDTRGGTLSKDYDLWDSDEGFLDFIHSRADIAYNNIEKDFNRN